MTSIILLELTLREIVADIPHDLGALIVYALLATFVGMTWMGSRKRPTPPSGKGALPRPRD